MTAHVIKLFMLVWPVSIDLAREHQEHDDVQCPACLFARLCMVIIKSSDLTG